MIRYCTSCVLPSTKPDLAFSADGRCQACINYSARSEVDYAEREAQFVKILEEEKSSKSSAWDCLVPVSGGKDSTFQIMTIMRLGYNPLAVTARTCDLAPIGRRNLENLRSLGVDHVDISPNPRVRAKLNRIGLEEVGDISWAEHLGIFTLPVRAALLFRVPLIIWGENSQNEYGGPPEKAENRVLDRSWLEEFGGLLGLRVSDIVHRTELSVEDLHLYEYPEAGDLARVGVRGLFLGSYFPWDGVQNMLQAQTKGFEVWPRRIFGSAVNYENLDNYQAGIHDYFKFLKFGFGRAADLASMHVRRGRLTRAQALEISQEADGKFPSSYLDKPLEEILEPLEISLVRFREICDEFTNTSLFETDSRGNLVRDGRGDLVKVNYDNVPGNS